MCGTRSNGLGGLEEALNCENICCFLQVSKYVWMKCSIPGRNGCQELISVIS